MVIGSATPPGRLHRALGEAAARAADLHGLAVRTLDHGAGRGAARHAAGIAAKGGSLHHHLGRSGTSGTCSRSSARSRRRTAAYVTSADFTDGAPGHAAEAQLDALLDALVVLAERLGEAPQLGRRPCSHDRADASGRGGRHDAAMRISAKADDGIRALIELAALEEERDGPVKRDHIGQAQEIPVAFLENILLELKRAGIVRASAARPAGSAWPGSRTHHPGRDHLRPRRPAGERAPARAPRR